MTRHHTVLIVAIALLAATAVYAGVQIDAPPTPAWPGQQTFRSTTAVTYDSRRETEIDLMGTPLLPRARGEVDINVETASLVRIEAHLRDMTPARLLGQGQEYLTYVLWAVPPRGRAKNLGEIQIEEGRASIEATSSLRTFALIVTAEPYYAVTAPSDVVVLENAVRGDIRGRTSAAALAYEVVPRGTYVAAAGTATYMLPASKRDEPLDVQQARNAVAIAQLAEAQRYSPEGFATAQHLLTQTEQLIAQETSRRDIISQARATVQAAEEARVQSVGRRAAEEAQSRQAAFDRGRGGAAQRDADAARAEAEAARAAALRAQAGWDRAELRETLRRDFNDILDTSDTPRGLVVDVSDLLFEAGRYELTPAAREKLTRVAAVVMAHPGLSLRVEGVDARRADAVGDFLIVQGLFRHRVTTPGSRSDRPVGTSGTREGVQQNRRVEIVVTGEVIEPPVRRDRP